MRKPTIKHIYLRKVIEEVENQDNPSLESINRLVNELKHSSLIMAGDFLLKGMNFPSISVENEDYGLLFTDMDEFYKVFSKNEFEAHENVFEFFKRLLDLTNLKGYIINIKSEAFMISEEMIELFGEMPECYFTTDEAYSTEELKQLKDEIDNEELEKFVENPNNIGKYEQLFEIMSSSTLLTLMLSKKDLKSENGVIDLKKTGSVGFLYINENYGNYATIYTSLAKMDYVNTKYNKYSQLVNFSQMTNSVLYEDMDGIIINPDTDNVILTREVLLEFSPIIDEICNDSKLNSGIFHIFSMEGV